MEDQDERRFESNTLYNEATLLYRTGYHLIYGEVVVGQLRGAAIIQSSRDNLNSLIHAAKSFNI